MCVQVLVYARLCKLNKYFGRLIIIITIIIVIIIINIVITIIIVNIIIIFIIVIHMAVTERTFDNFFLFFADSQGNLK